MIKAVFFDVGGVLGSFVGREERKRNRRRLLRLPEPEIEPYFRSRQMLDLHRGKITELQFWEIFCKKKKLRKLSSREAYSLLAFRFRPNKSMLAFASRLRKAGLITGIISNTFPPRDARVRTVYGQFRPCILSYKVGFVKPERGIFSEALRRAGVKPGESVFIDDREDVIAAAKKIGFHSIHYKNYPDFIRAFGKLKIAHPVRSKISRGLSHG